MFSSVGSVTPCFFVFFQGRAWPAKGHKLSKDHPFTMSGVGTDVLDKFAENACKSQEESDALLQRQSMKEGALEKWMACPLIRNSDQSKKKQCKRK